MTGTSLDSILSGSSEPAPETEEKVVATNEAQVDPPAQEQEEPAIDEDNPPVSTNERGQKMVPIQALDAKNHKIKRYTEEVADFRKSNESLQRQVSELLQRIPVPQAEKPEQQPDWFENPDAALEQRLGKSISPLASTVSRLETQFIRLAAMQTHGVEKVTAFEKHIDEAMAKGDPEMAALSAQMRASPDPMKTGLDWFEKRTFDPTAERERIKAELLAEINKGQQQEEPAPQAQAAPVMPSSFANTRNVGARSGAPWSGPPTLDDIFAR